MRWRMIPLATIALPLCVIAEQLPIRSYTTADGLASDQIDCIVPDSRGFVWFCTPEGLTRFDGYRMVNFGTQDGLPDRGVDAFLETRSGAYLVGTNRGLSRFDPRAGGQGFVNYRQGAGVFDKPILALFESPSGRIWCGSTAARLFEALRADFRLTKLSGNEHMFVTGIQEDAGGKLWVATNGGIYVLGKDGAVQFIAKLHGSPWNMVSALLLDHAGRIWAATRGGLLMMRVDDAVVRCGIQREYGPEGGLQQSDPRALAEGPDGAIWIATDGGISVLPKSGDPPFRNLTRDQGLTDSSIYALAADKAGNIWAGTEGAGVMRIGSAGFTTFHARDGLATDRVTSILADRTGAVMAVTDASAHAWWRSINAFDPVNLRFHKVFPKVFGEKASWALHPSLLHARTGEWWAATKAGLCRFASMSVAELAARQPRCYTSERGLEMFTVFEDSKGGIWASAQSLQGKGNRLLRWDPARKTISWIEDGPTRDELVESFAEDHYGNVWMGPARDNLFRYDGRRFKRFKRSDGVPAGVIDALLVDHTGRLWIGSNSSGLGLVENPGGAPFLVRTYNMAAGLASDTVLSLVEDDMGRIYAGTGKGVDRLDPATGHIKHFSTADGLAHGGVVSAFRDSSGDLWFGTMEGLSRLTPTAGPPARPTVLITGLKLFGKTYPVSHAGEAHIRLPDLDPSRNQFQVAFVGFNGEPEDRLRYTYKLDGAGSDWKAPDREHEANYPGLEPGHYRFLVKAVNSEDQASNTPAEIDFTVLPPFYGRWWFEAMAGAVIAGLVFAAYRYRLLEMTARVKLRYESGWMSARELRGNSTTRCYRAWPAFLFSWVAWPKRLARAPRVPPGSDPCASKWKPRSARRGKKFRTCAPPCCRKALCLWS